MCGITGWIDWQQDVSEQNAIISLMIGRLSHRGPDAHDSWFSKRAALAHHRLKVIDPLGGGQPMVYQMHEQTYVINYNGELYNFRELYEELKTRGHTFRTQSDTEVLLHTYLEWGENCTQHLNGIFAFGLWDEGKQQLLLARDHLGVKPLFYTQRGSAVLFASEIKALLVHPLVEAEVDAEGLAELFMPIIYPLRTPGFVIYANMYQVRPGEQIIFTPDGNRIGRYWYLRSMPHTDDLETTTERIRVLLDDSVRRQLIVDVPVVAMLSGGIDSSGIVALIASEFQREQRPVHTYSIDFVGHEQYASNSSVQVSLDEPWARRVAEYIGTQHHTILVDSSELVESLLQPVYAHDMPSVGQMEASLYLFCKAMKQDATVALSGEGADEVFGGYSWFFNEEARSTNNFPWLVVGGNQASPWWSSDINEKFRPQEALARRYQEALEEVPVLEGEDAFHSKMREISYLALTRFLQFMLDRKDRMSMASGFEVRVPFCDYRLVEYVWNIPWEMKTFGTLEKGILRRALADVLPEDVRKRKKSPYPYSLHPHYQQEISKWFSQILHDAGAPIRPFLNMPIAWMLAEGSLAGQSAALRFASIERIIQVNAWMQEYHIRIR